MSMLRPMEHASMFVKYEKRLESVIAAFQSPIETNNILYMKHLLNNIDSPGERNKLDFLLSLLEDAQNKVEDTNRRVTVLRSMVPQQKTDLSESIDIFVNRYRGQGSEKMEEVRNILVTFTKSIEQ